MGARRKERLRHTVNDRTETIPERRRTGSGSPGSSLPTDDPNRYQLAGEHARGGLGRILKARDERLGRTVAVKELIERTVEHEAQFVREALITARLQHPGIVPVHEAGRWPSGDPYYVMKLISGQSLKELIAARQTIGERMSLLPNVIAVAEAIGYAHSQGVIHRDIKPSNIVVGEFGETVVVDWGLAKDLRAAAAGSPAIAAAASPEIDTALTADIIGTPAYMPPEQAQCAPVDERADVYAIGAVLYHTLTGAPPYAGQHSGDIVSCVVGGPPVPVERKQPGLPKDLVAVVDKAMRRDPSERYRTAKELAEDLKRFQTGQLVTAHAYSHWTLLGRWLHRYRAAVGVAIVGVAISSVMGVVAVRRIIDERNVAQRERAQAQAAQRSTEDRRTALLFLQAQTSLDRDPTATIAWLKQYPHQGPQFKAIPGMIDRARALGVAQHVFRHDDWVYEVAFSPDGAMAASASKDGTVRGWDLATGRGTLLLDNDLPVRSLAFSRGGEQLAVGDAAGRIHLVSLRGEPTVELNGHESVVWLLGYTPDGTRLVSVSDDGQARVWRDGSTTPERTIEHRKGAESPVFSRNLRFWASIDERGRVTISSTETGRSAVVPQPLPAPRVLSYGVADTGAAVLAVTETGQVMLWRDGAQGWSVLGVHDGPVIQVAFSASGRLAATAGTSGAVGLWEIEGSNHRVLRGHADALYQVAFSPDDSSLVSASDDGTARLWDLETGTARVLRGHEDDVYAARFSPDGSRISTASLDGTLRIWPTRSDESTVLVGHDVGYMGNMRFATDARWLITQAVGGNARVWDTRTGEGRDVGAPWPGAGFPAWQLVRPAAISPDGRHLAAPRAAGGAELFSADSPVRAIGQDGETIYALEFSPDGKALVLSNGEGAVSWLDILSGERRVLFAEDSPVLDAKFSPDGRRLALIESSGIALWSIADGAIARRAAGKDARWYRGEFSPDGEKLAAISRQGSFTVWDLESGQQTDFHADKHHIMDVSFSPDGAMIAAAVADRTVRVWNLDQGGEPRILGGHTDLVYRVQFSPDGALLASSSHDGTIRLWKRGSWESRVLHGHAAAVDAIDFSADGSLLASMGRDGTVRLWKPELDLDPPPTEIESRLAAISTAVIGADDRPQTAQE